MTKQENSCLKEESSTSRVKLEKGPNLLKVKRSDVSTSENSASISASDIGSKFRRHTLSSLNKRIFSNGTHQTSTTENFHNIRKGGMENMLKKTNSPGTQNSGSKFQIKTNFSTLKKNENMYHKGQVGAGYLVHEYNTMNNQSRNKNYNWTYTGGNLKKEFLKKAENTRDASSGHDVDLRGKFHF